MNRVIRIIYLSALVFFLIAFEIIPAYNLTTSLVYTGF